MPNPLLTLIARGGVNPGVIAGTAVAEEQNAKKTPTTKKGAIIGIIIGSVCLLILIAGAVIASRRSKSKKARGTKIAEVGGTYEEVRPLAAEGYPMAVGGAGHTPAPMVLQPGVSYQPPQYQYPSAQGGYPQGPQGQALGQQGTDFYRNQ
jgi:hypothetical protein